MNKPQLPIGILICAVVVLVASFMTWGTLTGEPTMSVGFQGQALYQGPVTTTGNAWSGMLTIASIDVPNWIVVPIAAMIACFAFLRELSIWTSPRIVDVVLVAIGLWQVLMMMMLYGEHGRIGIGSIITTVCYGVLAIVSTKGLILEIAERRHERQVRIRDEMRERILRQRR